MKFSASSLLKSLARPSLMAWILPWLMVLVTAGTVAQKYLGLYASQKIFFGSFILWLGPIPLPGAFTTIGLILIALLVKFITASQWSWQKSGTIITHMGALILLFGGLLTATTAREIPLTIHETQTTHALPFDVTLNDVTEDLYPGTGMARAYHSDIVVTDGPVSFPATISMNQPLRYRGYTLYQSSFIRDEKGEATIITAVTNTGRLFPYVSCALIAFGLLLHALINAGALKFILRAAFALLIFIPHGAQAAAPLSMDNFARIPILHEGRLKPMESFARIHLQLFANAQHIDGMNADEWLAELLFNPLTAAQRRLFTVQSRDTIQALHLPSRTEARYSFMELSQALSTDKTPADSASEINTLRSKIIIFTQIMRSASLLLPLAVDVPPALGKGTEGMDYLALQKLRERAATKLKSIIAAKGTDLNKYTDSEKSVAQFSWQINLLTNGGSENIYFRVIPPSWADDDGEWLSPWSLVLSGHGSPAAMAALGQWKNLAQGWLNADNRQWTLTSRDITAQAVTMAHLTPLIRAQLQTEIYYDRIHPFAWAMLFYVLTLFITVIPAKAGIFNTQAEEDSGFRRNDVLVLCAAALAILTHGLGLATRMFILMRPPVGTLYESLLFVSLIVAGLGFLLSLKQKNLLPIICSAVSALGILAASVYFAAHDGDTLTVLVAVLNTNFWLGTHVIFITGGYGICLLTALLAHAYLAGHRTIFPLMHRMALTALFCTTTGTMLGGIWADQSWGRFWGWDPKENGALMIILWLVWLLHGRMAGMFKPPLYAAGLAALSIVVALSWFGVNLLSVGLHSYGFISGIAMGLASFCVAEILLISALYYRGNCHAAA